MRCDPHGQGHKLAPCDAMCPNGRETRLPRFRSMTWNFASFQPFMIPPQSSASLCLMGLGLVKDKTKMQETGGTRGRRGNDGLGANSDIGAKLRAYYGAVQDQPIPDKFLDLLEKLDAVEQASKRKVD